MKLNPMDVGLASMHGKSREEKSMRETHGSEGEREKSLRLSRRET